MSEKLFCTDSLLVLAQWLAAIFVLLIITLIVSVGVMYVVDKTQNKHTIRRNCEPFWLLHFLRKNWLKTVKITKINMANFDAS